MNRLALLFFFFITPLCFCQNISDIGTLATEFDNLYRKSSTYKEYKVISTKKYKKLKNNTLSILNSQKKIINQKTLFIETSQQEIQNLKENLSITKANLNTAIELKDHRYFFGTVISQSTLSFILIATYSLLILLLVFFIFKYKQNINTTKEATSSLVKLETEFEEHKKKALVRFQEVNRKLQDELNKNWKKDK